MYTVPRILAFSILTLASAFPAVAQDAVLMRYKFGPKDKLIYRTTASLKQTLKFRGNKQETTINSTSIVERRLEKVDSKKNFVLESENKSLTVSMKIGGAGSYKFDSKSDENERASRLGAALTPVYETLSGAILKVTISPRGEIVSVKGYKELLAAALKDNPLATQFTGGGTDKAIQMEYTEFFPVFSKKAVKPGDTWVVPFEISLAKLGTAKGQRSYKFVGMEKVKDRSVAKITYTYDLTFKLDLAMGGTKVTGEVSIGKSSGTVLFDVAKGQLVSLKAQYQLGGDLTRSANGVDIDIRTDQLQKLTVEQLDKLPE